MSPTVPVGYRLPVAAADPTTANALVEAANALFGAHDGRRALHAKGAFCDATFTPSPAAAELCRAAIFAGPPVPALVRLSNGGGKPDSNDAGREARGLAVKLRPPHGDECDILATTTPAFIVRTPEEFLELMRLRVPDSETGELDMEALGAFFGDHPESQTAVAATMGAEPPASFATLAYFSPHSFRFLDAGGQGRWGRYRWRPQGDEQRISDDEAAARGRDYLFEDLRERLATGPITFDLVIVLAGDGDPIDDPTAVWPEDRETVEAGRLEITAPVADPEGDGHIEVFDPTRVPDGIELSDDPVLHARRAAYSASAYKRLGMEIGPVP
jgi:catalase